MSAKRVSTHAVYCHERGPPSVDLYNDVHSLFAPKKLIFLSATDYELLKPAFQAASLIMTNMTQDFWLALKHGEVRTSQDGPNTPSTFHRRKQTADMSQADHTAVTTLFDDLTGHVHCFRFWPDKADGKTYPFMINGRRCCSIKLGQHLLLNIQQADNEVARVHHLFMLTVTILHELVHAANDMFRGVANEMFFEDDAICEMGEAYENLLLGGVPMVYRNQILLRKWPWTQDCFDRYVHGETGSTATLRGKLPESDVQFAIASSDVRKIFRRAYWTEVIDGKIDRVELTVTGGVIEDEGK